jgi:hypothetical protein
MSVVLGCTLLGAGAWAAPTDWTDWLAAGSGNVASAQGLITRPDDTIDVYYAGEITFAQTSGGKDYWVPSAPFTDSVVGNPPTGSDIIVLTGLGGTNWIIFSEPVTNPVMAVNSLGKTNVEVDYDFDAPFVILSQGSGYWPGGTLEEAPGNVLVGHEGYGVIQFQGTFTSITWTVSNPEYWHGFTVGLPRKGDVYPPVAPAPGALLLGAAGTLTVGYLRRRKAL